MQLRCQQPWPKRPQTDLWPRFTPAAAGLPLPHLPQAGHCEIITIFQAEFTIYGRPAAEALQPEKLSEGRDFRAPVDTGYQGKDPLTPAIIGAARRQANLAHVILQRAHAVRQLPIPRVVFSRSAQHVTRACRPIRWKHTQLRWCQHVARIRARNHRTQVHVPWR
mgnify:CR=1 FL=1